MKARRVLATLFLITALSLIGVAQDSRYQKGKIVSIHKVLADSQTAQQPEPRTGQTDAPLKSDTVRYEMVVDAGGKSYTCQYLAQSDLDSAWGEGKEVQVRVKERMVYIKKANGKPERLSLMSSKPIGG